KPKRKRDDSWFKDKVLLEQVQASGQILHEEELAFLANTGIAGVALMANLSHYGSDALARVHNPDNVDNNMINQGVQINLDNKSVNDMLIAELESYKEQVKVLKEGQNVETDLSAEQVFWSQNSVNSEEPNLSIRSTQVEVPKELPKVSMVNTSLKNLKHHLASFDVSLEEVFVITALKDTLRKLKRKAVVDEAVILHPIDPELLKIDVSSLAPKL
nr:hypothetical protein [Tanacetum cinerariifolium]